MNLNIEKTFKILSFFIILIFGFLFIHEIYDYNTLLSINDVPATMDFLKYKEDAISQSFLWLLFVLFGFGLFKKNSLGWIIPQSLFLIVISILSFFIYKDYENITLQRYIIWVLSIITFIIILRYFQTKKPLFFFNVGKNKIILYYILIIFLSTSYFFMFISKWQKINCF